MRIKRFGWIAQAPYSSREIKTLTCAFSISTSLLEIVLAFPKRLPATRVYPLSHLMYAESPGLYWLSEYRIYRVSELVVCNKSNLKFWNTICYVVLTYLAMFIRNMGDNYMADNNYGKAHCTISGYLFEIADNYLFFNFSNFYFSQTNYFSFFIFDLNMLLSTWNEHLELKYLLVY